MSSGVRTFVSMRLSPEPRHRWFTALRLQISAHDGTDPRFGTDRLCVPRAVQWLEVRWPSRRAWIDALASFRPTMRAVFPRAAYFVVTASRAATDDASHTWASDMSITTS